MAMSRRLSGIVAASVAVALAAVAPAHAAPWAKSADIVGEPGVEQVNWRGRRNGALVAGAIGLGVLGIAAAAAASERRGYGGGYDRGYGHGYGPSYGYAPSYGYRQTYEYEVVQPRHRYVEAPYHGYGPVYRDEYPVYRRQHVRKPQHVHDYGRGPQRARDPAGSN